MDRYLSSENDILEFSSWLMDNIAWETRWMNCDCKSIIVSDVAYHILKPRIKAQPNEALEAIKTAINPYNLVGFFGKLILNSFETKTQLDEAAEFIASRYRIIKNDTGYELTARYAPFVHIH
jgi:hypothetical protein